MTESDTFPPDRQADQVPQQQARVTKGDLVRGDAEKVVSERTEHVALFHKGGGLDLASLRDMVDAAKLLSSAGPYLPGFLQGNVGAMLFNLMRAHELGISPLALANWTYVVEQTINGEKVQRVGYESQFYHSIIEAHAPIKDRLQVSYEGQGDARRCRVFATFEGETEPRYFPPLDADPEQFTLGRLRPKRNQSGKVMGSPLWDSKPDLQLFYAMSRDWARMFIPDILAGQYSKDELEDAGFTVASEAAKNISPGIASRLRGNPNNIGQAAIAAIDAARADSSPKKPKTESATEQKDAE